MTFGCLKITYIPRLLWWFTGMNLTQKMLHKCSVLLIIIIQRILSCITSTSFLHLLWSPFYSACSFYSLLIKWDFSQQMLSFLKFEYLTQQSWAMSIPSHSPPYCSGSASQPLVLPGAILRESHSSGKALEEEVVLFWWSPRCRSCLPLWIDVVW